MMIYVEMELSSGIVWGNYDFSNLSGLSSVMLFLNLVFHGHK